MTSRPQVLLFEDDHLSSAVQGGIRPLETQVSKSRFKARALEYFREVERTGRPLVITDRNRPVLQLRPYKNDPEEVLRALRGSVKHFENPTEPVGVEDWEVGG